MPERKRIRVVVDANWYISACISRKSRRTLYYNIFKNHSIKAFYSAELLTEFEEVIDRQKFRKIITSQQVARFKSFALLFLNTAQISAIPSLVRDEDDNYLLGLCESCQADFLITGDQDLLALESYQNTTILTMGQFLSIIDSKHEQ